MPRKILIFILGILFGGGVWIATNVMRVKSSEGVPSVQVSPTQVAEESQEIEESADLEAKQELKSQ